MSEYPALLYMNMQSENRKPPINLIESIFYVYKKKTIKKNKTNLHIMSLWTANLTKSLKILFSSFWKVVLTNKTGLTDWLADRQNEKKK